MLNKGTVPPRRRYAGMARFYLDLQNTQASSRDETGSDYPDLESARQAAIAGIRSILSDEVLDGEIDLNGKVSIFDEQRRLVLTVPYSEAVTVSPAEPERSAIRSSSR